MAWVVSIASIWLGRSSARAVATNLSANRLTVLDMPAGARVFCRGFIRLCGLRHYLHFAWKLMKTSVEAFTAFMEASMEDMEASMDAIIAVEASIHSMKDLMKASVKAPTEASMADMEDVKASSEVPSTGASTKASMEAFVEVMEAFAEDMEAFEEVTSAEASMEDMEDMKASTDVTSTGVFTKASTRAS